MNEKKYNYPLVVENNETTKQNTENNSPCNNKIHKVNNFIFRVPQGSVLNPFYTYFLHYTTSDDTAFIDVDKGPKRSVL